MLVVYAYFELIYSKTARYERGEQNIVRFYEGRI